MKVYGIVNILGKFWPQRTSAISEVDWSVEDEGRILFDGDNSDFYYGSSTGWEKLESRTNVFSFGSKLIFASTLPTNWNIDLTIESDPVVVLSGWGLLIGRRNGDWEITGMNDSGSHDHYTPDNLGVASETVEFSDDDPDEVVSAESHKHTLTYGGSHSHTFDGTWKPAYVRFVIGEYQE